MNLIDDEPQPIVDPPLSIIRIHSESDEDKYKAGFAHGNLADLPEIVDIICALNDDLTEYEPNAIRINHYVRFECTDKFDIFKLRKKMDKSLITSVIQEQLILALWSLPKLETLHLRCFHQFPLYSTNIDVLVAEDIILNNKKGCLPRLVMKVFTKQEENIGSPLYNDIHNLSKVWPENYQFIVLGVIIVDINYITKVDISVYYTTYNRDTNTTCLSEISLYSGYWESHTISCILAAITTFCHISLQQFNFTNRHIPQIILKMLLLINRKK